MTHTTLSRAGMYQNVNALYANEAVACVAVQVVSDLGIQSRPSELLLCIDGFTLPAEAPADIIRDGDHVTVMSKVLL